MTADEAPTGARRPGRRGRRRATRPADGGSPLPGSTDDDTDLGWGERPHSGGAADDARDDERLRADRPPHHDQGW